LIALISKTKTILPNIKTKDAKVVFYLILYSTQWTSLYFKQNLILIKEKQVLVNSCYHLMAKKEKRYIISCKVSKELNQMTFRVSN
jgi:hypothetical protein